MKIAIYYYILIDLYLLFIIDDTNMYILAARPAFGGPQSNKSQKLHYNKLNNSYN